MKYRYFYHKIHISIGEAMRMILKYLSFNVCLSDFIIEEDEEDPDLFENKNGHEKQTSSSKESSLRF